MSHPLCCALATRYTSGMTETTIGTVHLLYVGTYDEREVVGVFATHEAAEREILARAYRGDSLEEVTINAHEVQP